jgi:hypothetical protein
MADSALWDVWQVFYAPYSECGPAKAVCDVNEYDSTLGYGYSMHPAGEPSA